MRPTNSAQRPASPDVRLPKPPWAQDRGESPFLESMRRRMADLGISIEPRDSSPGLIPPFEERPRAPSPADPGPDDDPTPDGPGTAAAVASPRDEEITMITKDLLAGLESPGPALIALAGRTAAAIRRGLSLDAALDGVSSTGKSDALALMERIGRLRELEDRVVQRGLLALELLRQRSVQVTAQVKPARRAAAGGARRQ